MNDATWILLAMLGYTLVIMWHNYQMAMLVMEEVRDAKHQIIKAIKENGKLN